MKKQGLYRNEAGIWCVFDGARFISFPSLQVADEMIRAITVIRAADRKLSFSSAFGRVAKADRLNVQK